MSDDTNNKIEPDDNLILTTELASQDLYCELWHPEDVPPKAINYILQKFLGTDGSENIMSIPVCGDCIGHLSSGTLILFYCCDCGSSQWKLRRNFKYGDQYGNGIVWCQVCPHCGGEDTVWTKRTEEKIKEVIH